VTAPPSGVAAERIAVDPERQSGARRRALGDEHVARSRSTLLADATPASTAQGPALPAGYGSLDKLAATLPKLDRRFTSQTVEGRATMALALAIGGTEAFGKGQTGTDFFTRRGGTGNNMRGFAQYNLAYHDRATRTPQGYAKHVADMMTGARVMPNSEPASNHAAALVTAIRNGSVDSGADLARFMRRRGFGGSNWQGIDDGWSRAPGLGDALIRYVRDALPGAQPNA
jgi:hypothetical protein